MCLRRIFGSNREAIVGRSVAAKLVWRPSMRGAARLLAMLVMLTAVVPAGARVSSGLAVSKGAQTGDSLARHPAHLDPRRLQSVVTGTIATDGTATTVTISNPGDTAELTFSESAGHRVSLSVTDTSFQNVDVSIWNQAGTTRLGDGISAAAALLPTPLSPVFGTVAAVSGGVSLAASAGDLVRHPSRRKAVDLAVNAGLTAFGASGATK